MKRAAKISPPASVNVSTFSQRSTSHGDARLFLQLLPAEVLLSLLIFIFLDSNLEDKKILHQMIACIP
jgi:hypothetical protein